MGERLAGKPHIYFRRGYWRVSPMGKPYYLRSTNWVPAHNFTYKLNDKLRKVNT